MIVTAIGSAPSAGAVVDADGVLLDWMRRRGVDTLVLRPDGYVYAAAPAGAHLSPPPTGFAPRPVASSTTR